MQQLLNIIRRPKPFGLRVRWASSTTRDPRSIAFASRMTNAVVGTKKHKHISRKTTAVEDTAVDRTRTFLARPGMEASGTSTRRDTRRTAPTTTTASISVQPPSTRQLSRSTYAAKVQHHRRIGRQRATPLLAVGIDADEAVVKREAEPVDAATASTTPTPAKAMPLSPRTQSSHTGEPTLGESHRQLLRSIQPSMQTMELVRKLRLGRGTGFTRTDDALQVSGCCTKWLHSAYLNGHFDTRQHRILTRV